MGDRPEERLPPGQYVTGGDWPVLHYGRVPRFDPATWDFRITGATASGRERRFDAAEFARLPRSESVAALHCVTRFSLPAGTWSGVAASTLLELAPPAAAVTHVMVWAASGYSANLRLADLAAPGVVVANHRDGVPLTPEHGWPYRLVLPHLYGWKGAKWVRALEYLTEDRRGFWEERGYHTRAEVWSEQRYAYQEDVPEPGEPGPGPTGS